MQLNQKNQFPESTPSQKILTSEKIILDVGGMKCGGCVNAVEKQLTQHLGVKSVCVNLTTEVAVVEIEPGAVDADTLIQRLTATGFPSQVRTAKSAGDQSAFPPTPPQDSAKKCSL
jgi:Cu2+-exporting ATPase